MENILVIAYKNFSEEIIDRLLKDDKVTALDIATSLQYAKNHNLQNVIDKIKKSEKISADIIQESESIRINMSNT